MRQRPATHDDELLRGHHGCRGRQLRCDDELQRRERKEERHHDAQPRVQVPGAHGEDLGWAGRTGRAAVARQQAWAGPARACLGSSHPIAPTHQKRQTGVDVDGQNCGDDEKGRNSVHLDEELKAVLCGLVDGRAGTPGKAHTRRHWAAPASHSALLRLPARLAPAPVPHLPQIAGECLLARVGGVQRPGVCRVAVGAACAQRTAAMAGRAARQAGRRCSGNASRAAACLPWRVQPAGQLLRRACTLLPRTPHRYLIPVGRTAAERGMGRAGGARRVGSQQGRPWCPHPGMAVHSLHAPQRAHARLAKPTWLRLKVWMCTPSTVHPLSSSPVAGEYSCVPVAAGQGGQAGGTRAGLG